MHLVIASGVRVVCQADGKKPLAELVPISFVIIATAAWRMTTEF
jgi:hypothetical protein